MEANICRNCGSFNFIRTGNLMKCKHCDLTYNVESEQKIFDKLYDALNELDKKEVANLKNKLYEALQEEYPNAKEVVSICQEIRTHVFDDFVASLYYHAYEIKINHNAIRHYAEFLNDIDVEENYPFVEKVITLATQDLKKELDLPVRDLIQRASSKNIISVEKKGQLISALEIESQKLDNEVYNPKVPRDFFIMHSGKDIKKVMNLVADLEREGRTCYVAQRNIQHGRGSEAVYNDILRTAMDHCKWIVFVSSRSSRNYNCQAVNFEMEYIKQKDIENLSSNMRYMDYAKIPNEHKKPRVEYVIEEYDGSNRYGEIAVNEFFSGLERVQGDYIDILRRYHNGWVKPSPIEDTKPPIKNVSTPQPTPPLNDPAEPLLEEAKELIEKNKNYDVAFEVYEEAAELGSPAAICNLGYMYETGLGVDRDVYKAVEYYKEAAEKGNARAMYNLGVCYELGVGVRCDEGRAAELFKKAAERNDSYAKKKLIGA